MRAIKPPAFNANDLDFTDLLPCLPRESVEKQAEESRFTTLLLAPIRSQNAEVNDWVQCAVMVATGLLAALLFFNAATKYEANQWRRVKPVVVTVETIR